MRISLMSLILVLNLILQSTIFQYIEIFGVRPNTAIIIIVSYAILRGDVEGALVGFFAGFLQDMFFGYSIGLCMFSFAMIGYICGKPFKDFFRENYILPIVLVLLSTLFYGFLLYSVNYLTYGKIQFSFYWNKIILPETIYTAVLTFFVYRIIYGVNRKIEAHEKKRQSLFGGKRS